MIDTKIDNNAAEDLRENTNIRNETNEAFVAAFEERYGYVPGSYAAQSYDAAQLIASALEKTGGKLDDKDAVRKALEEADFPSVRGKFSFSNNHYPIQDFHMLKVVKRDDGKYATSFVRTVVEDYEDGFHGECRM